MSAQGQTKKQPDNEQDQAVEESYAVRFVAMVEREWQMQMADDSGLDWTTYEKTLAQHAFLKVDEALREAEQKRLERRDADQRTPFTWKNVNLEKLALNTVHCVGLGLDPILPNHVHPVFYWNRREGKYDCNLQRGYAGKDLCARTMTLDPPLDIVYQLVHANDKFKPLWRSPDRPGDAYDFETPHPFDRGEVIGGFGYIIYDDPRKNRLHLVPKKEFELAEKNAGTDKFWKGDNRERMLFKTVVNRVADKLQIDPRKVNSRSYAYVTDVELQTVDDEMADEMADEANQGDVIDITPPAEGEAPAAPDHAAAAGTGAGKDEGPGF